MIAEPFVSQSKKFAQSQKGTSAVMFALSAPLLFLAVGVAVDYSHAVTEEQQMQAAVDAAVLAGATSAASTTQANGLTVASNYFSSDISWSGPSAQFAFNADGGLTGTATYSMPTLYSSFTGISSLSLQVTATAAAASFGTTNNVCLLLLSTTVQMLANGGTNIKAPNCEIDVASTTANPADTLNASVTIQSEKLCLAAPKSSMLVNDQSYLTDYTVFTPSCATAANPFVGKLPAPTSTTCSGSTAYGGTYSGTVTLSPGVYCGGFNFNSGTTVTLQPGLYVIKGGSWVVDGGSMTGSGVTFYFADTSLIQFNGGMTLTLSAPTTGTYAGILMYEKDGLSESSWNYDNSAAETLTGLIYLPSRDVTFNSTSNETTTGTFIANSGTFDKVNWNLSPGTTWTVPHTASGGAATPTVLSQ